MCFFAVARPVRWLYYRFWNRSMDDCSCVDSESPTSGFKYWEIDSVSVFPKFSLEFSGGKNLIKSCLNENHNCRLVDRCGIIAVNPRLSTFACSVHCADPLDRFFCRRVVLCAVWTVCVSECVLLDRQRIPLHSVKPWFNVIFVAQKMLKAKIPFRC